MDDEANDFIPKPLIRWHVPALIVACLGLLFMLFIAVNTAMRYGLTWNFDIAHNDHIGTFIASVAGTLFGLTNALLLFETLRTQQRASAQNAKQHRELVQDRQYERFTERINAIEAEISSYQAEVLPDPVIASFRTLAGIPAWENLFQRWILSSNPTAIYAELKRHGRIDPASYLPEQGRVLDLIIRLDSVLVEGKRLLTDGIDKAYLINKADRLQKQMSKCRPQVQETRNSLRSIVDGDGLDEYPQSQYASELLHIIAELDQILNVLPEFAYRNLSPMAKHMVRFDHRQRISLFTSQEVPTVQIDGIAFQTKDPNWLLRINHTRLKVSIETLDPQERQLGTQVQHFEMSLLIDTQIKQDPSFDTKGRWRTEGSYNPFAQLEQHALWKIRIEYVGLELAAKEYLELSIFTNATTV